MSASQSGGRAIVLAAGRSTRMGRPKASLAFQGGTFLTRILEELDGAGFARPIVVAALDLDAPAAALRVENAEPDRGQGWSLCLGLEAAAGAPFALVTLVDHPAVRAATFAAVAAEAQRRPGRIVVATHRGERGHPVAWPAALFAELAAAWDAPEGARAVLARHADLVVEIDAGDPGVLVDVDTPADYAEMAP